LESLLADAPESLPILRQSCIQVLNLTQDKRSSASDIGDIIKRDQGMMANIIKIANSPAYYTRVAAKTPTHAVALIGFDVIQAMVVVAQLIEQANTFGANSSCLKHLNTSPRAWQSPELPRARIFIHQCHALLIR
jgi:HD-like signal output (HDOD) protein